MKRGINFYETFFLLLLACKAMQIRFFGVVPSWLEVLAPLALWALMSIAGLLAAMFSWEDRTKFILWKWAANKKAREAGKTAAKDMKQYLNKTANPGQAYDTK
jgi:hypothetical protein